MDEARADSDVTIGRRREEHAPRELDSQPREVDPERELASTARRRRSAARPRPAERHVETERSGRRRSGCNGRNIRHRGRSIGRPYGRRRRRWWYRRWWCGVRRRELLEQHRDREHHRAHERLTRRPRSRERACADTLPRRVEELDLCSPRARTIAREHDMKAAASFRARGERIAAQALRDLRAEHLVIGACTSSDARARLEREARWFGLGARVSRRSPRPRDEKSDDQKDERPPHLPGIARRGRPASSGTPRDNQACCRN